MEIKDEGIDIWLPFITREVLTCGKSFVSPCKYTAPNLQEAYVATHHDVCKDLRSQKNLWLEC